MTSAPKPTKGRNYFLTIKEDGSPTHICLFERCDDREQLRLVEYSAYQKAIEALILCLPAIEEAYWDNYSAGVFPGRGYHHRCYDKLPFNWRQSKEFENWINEIKTLVEL